MIVNAREVHFKENENIDLNESTSDYLHEQQAAQPMRNVRILHTEKLQIREFEHIDNVL